MVVPGFNRAEFEKRLPGIVPRPEEEIIPPATALELAKEFWSTSTALLLEGEKIDVVLGDALFKASSQPNATEIRKELYRLYDEYVSQHPLSEAKKRRYG